MHGNTCPHTAAHTVQTFQQLYFKILKDPPNNPDLALSKVIIFFILLQLFCLCDNHVFEPFKEAIILQDQALKDAVHKCLDAQPKTFYSEGIQKLVQAGPSVQKWVDNIKNDAIVNSEM